MSIREPVLARRPLTPVSRLVRSAPLLALVACSSCSSKPAPGEGASQKSDTATRSSSALQAGDDTYSVFRSRSVAAGPAARTKSSLIFDPNAGRSILFGGIQASAPVDETWSYDGNWSKCPGSSCTTHPSARGEAGFAFALDLNGGVGILFGGVSLGTPLCDTWEWNGTTGAWTARSSPASCPEGPGITSGRFGQAMAGFGNRVASFGGFVASPGGYPPTADALVWDGSAWSELCDTACAARSSGMPSARGDATLTRVVTPSHDSLYLYGGRGPSSSLADLWEFDLVGKRWIERCSASCGAQGPRAGHGAAFDPIRKKIFVHGGCSVNACPDPALPPMEYDPELDAWTPIPKAIPSTEPNDKRYFGIAYDSKRRRMVEYGGQDGGQYLDQTAEYYQRGSTCSSDAECHTGVCARNPATAATGICAEPCANGAADDGSGPCVDGFRCNEACADKCRTCSDVPGVCTFVRNRPDTDTCTGDGSCNADGDCKLALGKNCLDNEACASKNCATYGAHVCSQTGCGVQPCVRANPDGSCVTIARGASYECANALTCGDDGKCLTACAADADCAPDYYCDAQDGKCKTGKRYGDSCTSSAECSRGAPCVDGVCCTTDCSGACEKCGAGGKCETLPMGSQPAAPRQACTGLGDCAGYCPGNGPSCVYPGATQRCERLDCPTGPGECKTSCDRDWITEWTCDGLGQCVESLPRDCGEYACHDGTCEQRCDDHSQCRAGAACDRRSGGCVPVRRGCASKFQIELQDGTIVDCKGYLCFGDNQCSQMCNANSECADGFDCKERRCEPRRGDTDAGATTDAGRGDGGAGPPAVKGAPPSDDGCALASHRQGSRAPLIVLLALAGLVYRRKARQTASPP
jgi:hypothetical protein